MTQARLNCAVARATGESLQTIQRRGFSPLSSRPRSRLSRRRERRQTVSKPQGELDTPPGPK